MHKRPSRNQILLYLAELLVILWLLPGCFQKPVQTAVWNGAEFVLQTSTSELKRYVSDGMELRPGVYQIRIDSHLQGGQLCQASLSCEDKPFRSLRGNGIWLREGREHTVFTYYICDRLKDVFVRLNFESGDISAVREVQIYRTGAGNRILLTLFLICAGVLNGILSFRSRIREGRVTVQRQIVFFSLAGVTALAFFPYLTDYMILGTDSANYLLRIETLADGTVSFRQSLADGLLPLYLPALLCRIGFPTMTSYKLSSLLWVCLAVWGAYHALYHCVQKEYAALLGAMAYTLFPWSLRLLYNEGAWGRYIVFAALPPLCAGLWELLQDRDTENTAGYWLRRISLGILCAVLALQGCLLDWKLSCNIDQSSIARWVPLLLMLTLAIAVCMLYNRAEKHRRTFLFVAVLLLLIPAVYCVNEIAFCSDVYYLYSAEPLLSGI